MENLPSHHVDEGVERQVVEVTRLLENALHRMQTLPPKECKVLQAHLRAVLTQFLHRLSEERPPTA
jgi:hypothetical protein